MNRPVHFLQLPLNMEGPGEPGDCWWEVERSQPGRFAPGRPATCGVCAYQTADPWECIQHLPRYDANTGQLVHENIRRVVVCRMCSSLARLRLLAATRPLPSTVRLHVENMLELLIDLFGGLGHAGPAQ